MLERGTTTTVAWGGVQQQLTAAFAWRETVTAPRLKLDHVERVVIGVAEQRRRFLCERKRGAEVGNLP